MTVESTVIYSGFLGDKPPSILVVDDDLTTRTMVQGILQKEGYRVYTAPDGHEGRQKALHLAPDLILLDVQMPGEDGLDVCRTLKAIPLTADIPVIFLSAQEDVTVKVEGFAAGGSDYVTKPYYPAELLARVRLHIRLQQACRAVVANHLDQVRTLVAAQRTLLPQPEEIPAARFAAVYLPRDQAGGDFYDVFQVMENVCDYLVADVSGHDLGTALPTAALKALIRQNASMLYPPRENLHLLNRHLRPVLHEGQYATLVYARINRPNRQLTLLNAGHGPSILLRTDGTVEVICQCGDLLGAFDAFEPDLRTFPVSPGERLFLFSDGIIEQGSKGNVSRSQGLAALSESLSQTCNLTLEETLRGVVEELLPDPDRLEDDVVLLGIEI